MKTFVKYLLLFPLAVLPLAAQPASFDFGVPVVLSPVQAPGTWYTDRYPPSGFVSPQVAPDGKGDSLKESIAAGDSNTGRPPAFSNSFYSTQGRKFDLPPNTLSVTIALYVPASWGTENERKAGFWSEACNPMCSGNGDFAIIEFQGPTTVDLHGPGYYPNGGVPGFYGWNNAANAGNGGYDLIGLPTGFTYNSWVQLTVTLIPGTGFVYTVGDKTLSSPFFLAGDIKFGNTILEGYNYAADYDIFWNGVGAPGAVQQRYFSNLNVGDSVIDITNDGSGPGNICVNVYAFDPSEEMVSCCTCPVTPNALNSLSVNSDLIANMLTALPPTSVTVKLVATSVPASQTCDPTSTSGTTTVSALHAWGTTLHAGPGSFAVTETPFSAVSSIGIPSDLASLTQTCRFIKFAGSGFGICTSCRLGGLGAVRQ